MSNILREFIHQKMIFLQKATSKLDPIVSLLKCAIQVKSLMNFPYQLIVNQIKLNYPVKMFSMMKFPIFNNKLFYRFLKNPHKLKM